MLFAACGFAPGVGAKPQAAKPDPSPSRPVRERKVGADSTNNQIGMRFAGKRKKDGTGGQRREEGKARRNRYFVPCGTSNLQQRRGGDGARPSCRSVSFRAFRRQRPRPESCSFPMKIMREKVEGE